MLSKQYDLAKYFTTGVRRLCRNAITANYRPRSGWSPPPSLAVLRPTLRCNLSCQICYDRGENIVRDSWSLEGMDSGAELDDSTWIELVTALAAFKPTFYITGGEPLLASTLIPIIRTIKQHGCYVSLNTNGVMLEQRAAELLDAGVDKIIVSLDGPPAVHDSVRGESFDALARGIREVQRLMKARGVKRPVIRLQCVISHLNLEHLEETVEEAAKLGCGEIRFQHPIFAFSPEACRVTESMKLLLNKVDISRPRRQWVDLTGQAALDTITRLVERSAETTTIAFEPDVQTKDIVGYYDEAAHPFPELCLSPWRRMDVSPAGDMGPCQGLYLGRFPDVHPRECWSGKAFRALRRHMLDNGLFGVCNRCCHREYGCPSMIGLGIS
jgi:MoaA/NifB/PqqE/SkfB family radical SAM enzyme